jgi:hypothetical protein
MNIDNYVTSELFLDTKLCCKTGKITMGLFGISKNNVIL